jgi:hypothetical protein
MEPNVMIVTSAATAVLVVAAINAQHAIMAMFSMIPSVWHRAPVTLIKTSKNVLIALPIALHVMFKIGVKLVLQPILSIKASV